MSLSELAVPDEWLPPSSSESVKRRIPSSGSLLRRRHLLNLKVRAFCIDVAVRLRSSVNSPLRLKGLCLSLIFRSSCRVVPTSCSSHRRAVSSSQYGLKNEGSSCRCSLPITSIRSSSSRPFSAAIREAPTSSPASGKAPRKVPPIQRDGSKHPWCVSRIGAAPLSPRPNTPLALAPS